MNTIPINIVSRVVHGLRVSVFLPLVYDIPISCNLPSHLSLLLQALCCVSYLFFLQNTSTSLRNSLPLPRPCKEIPGVGSWVGISVMKVDTMSVRDPDVTAVDCG